MNTDIRDPSCSKWASSSSLASAMSMGRSSPYVGQNHWRTSPMLSSTASDDYDEFEQPQLTSDCRRRPHSPVPSPTISPHTPTTVAIPFPADNNNNTKRQDVLLVNSSASFRPPSPAPRFTGFATPPLESPLSSVSPDHHVAINNDNTRLRTLKVSNGLPTNLPPAPRPIAQRSTPSKSTPPQPSFNSLRASYLTMLAHNTDTTPAAEPTTVAPNDMHSALQEINRLTASPEFRTIGDSFPDDFDSNTPLCGGDEAVLADEWLNEPLFGDTSPYLTSPHDVPLDDFGTSPMDTPLSSFMATPSLRDMDLESPLIHDSSSFFADFSDDLALFGATTTYPFELNAAETVAPKLPATDKMWTISPSTPALDAVETTFPKSGPVIPPSPARRRSNVTGTRKNLRPEALIPLDAPTQKRTYVTPSATSRKAVPDAIVKKRLHSAAFGEDDEELGELSPTASEAEVIEYKRRQNTLAARKSRKRKLEHQQALEEEVQTLKGQVTMWRERALMAQELLRGAGVNFSFDGAQA